MTTDQSADQTVDLVDYPAIAPDAMQRKIDSFLDSCRLIRESHRDDQRRARIALASRQADVLRARRDELASLLETGDAWLAAHPSDDDEEQWLTWEQEYRAIVDALRNGATVAFGTAPAPEQAQMWEVA